MFNIGTHSSCKLRMKEEDSELSHDIAENTQVCLSVLLMSIYIFFKQIFGACLLDKLCTRQH